MKKIFRYLTILIPLFIVWGCTDTMEDMNVSPYEISENTKTKSGIAGCKSSLNPMFKVYKNVSGSWQLQVQESLNAGLFSGYFMHPNLFSASGSGNNDDYKFNSASWNGQAHADLGSMMGAFRDLNKIAEELDDYYEFIAMGTVLKVLSASMVVDAFGPFPYLNYGKEFAPFDDPKDIYIRGFLPELDMAVDTLLAYSNDPIFKDRVKKSGADLSTFDGDLKKWVKLANTVRFRLAMRISDPDPKYPEVKAIANTYINKCLDPQYGVLDDKTGNFSIDLKKNNCINPYNFQSTQWFDLVLGADFLSFLGGYNDPRLGLFFLPSDTVVKMGYTIPYGAVRPGCKITNSKAANYEKLSLVKDPTFDIYPLVLAAEGKFLLAEAAYKGFATEKDAKTYYEEGVKTSFTTWGVAGADSYLANSTSKPMDYVDVFYNENNYPATTSVPVKWNEAYGLEQIMTQKWIALFPDAHNAWSEFRRTGYPKLKIPKIMEGSPNWDNTIPANNFVNRLPYPDNFKAINPLVSDAISKYLNGKDDGFQRLFWQKNNNVCDY